MQVLVGDKGAGKGLILEGDGYCEEIDCWKATEVGGVGEGLCTGLVHMKADN